MPRAFHVAEQTGEVEACVAHRGARLVACLMDNHAVGPLWCLVHATHLDAAEGTALAASGAVVGLCPITEANLGGRLFPAADHVAASGRYGLGTDSNLRIGWASEMRMLEDGQRLGRQERCVLSSPGGSTGETLFAAARGGGAQALDAPAAGIAPGAPAALVALVDRARLDLPAERAFDRWNFGRNIAVDRVWAAGRAVVTDGRHVARERIEQAYAHTVGAVVRG